MEEEESREIYVKLSVTLATGKDTSVAIAPSTHGTCNPVGTTGISKVKGGKP